MGLNTAADSAGFMQALPPPDRLYWLSPPGQRVIIVGYSESGTLTVNVSRKFNVLCFERQVFGIDPGNLTECDLPNQFEVTH